MEIVNTKTAVLSNFEVMSHLQKIKDLGKKQKGQLATITYETLRYLENTNCTQLTSKNIVDCLKALEPFNLIKNEKLMIINTPPATPLEIQLIVDESEERLTEEQVAKILEIVTEHLTVVSRNNETEAE